MGYLPRKRASGAVIARGAMTPSVAPSGDIASGESGTMLTREQIRAFQTKLIDLGFTNDGRVIADAIANQLSDRPANTFTNTPVNVGTGTNALRLNFLHNLKAGDNNDQFQTTVTTGPDDNYRLGIHIDQGVEGSVGILAGSGKVIKTGALTKAVKLTGIGATAGAKAAIEAAGGTLA